MPCRWHPVVVDSCAVGGASGGSFGGGAHTGALAEDQG